MHGYCWIAVAVASVIAFLFGRVYEDLSCLEAQDVKSHKRRGTPPLLRVDRDGRVMVVSDTEFIAP